MVQINFAKREINCKLVYYGPGLSGKTTNLEVVHKKAPASKKGELTSIATEGDRTLFFDYMPLELGKVGGMNTKFQLYTVPGQVYYNATRKLVLQGADGVVFVADSQADKMDENLESFQNLEENLREQGLDPKTIPMVLQWNKRDLPNVLTCEELDKRMNKYGAPTFEAVAVTGDGVFPTLKKLAQIVLEKLNREYGLQNESPGGGGKEPPAKEKVEEKKEVKAASAGTSTGTKRERASEPPAKREEKKPAAPPPDDRAEKEAARAERERAEKEAARAERERERERAAEKPAAAEKKPEQRAWGVQPPQPAPSGGGKKGLVIALVVVLLLVGGAIGAGFAAKLPPPAQKIYDQYLKSKLGGGSPDSSGDSGESGH
jgi:signal recognition particle receptor subunit beta